MDTIIYYLFFSYLPLFTIIYIVLRFIIKPTKAVFYKAIKQIKK